MRNESLRFVCKAVRLRVENVYTPFTNVFEKNEIVSIPVAHGEGNYVAPDEVLDTLERNGQVVFRYVNEDGDPTAEANPNGSSRNIAGIVNERGNVLGMMPHPERHAESLLGNADGIRVFRSIVRELTAAQV